MHPDVLMEYADQFDAGSMLPKVTAACQFVTATRNHAAIGELGSIGPLLDASAGTVVSLDADGIEFYP